MALNEELIKTKNLLHSSGAWVTLIHLYINASNSLRVACNISNDLNWNGYKWTALPVEVGMIKEQKDETPQVEIKICNITQIPESYAESYDGLIESSVTLYDLNTNNLLEVSNIKQYDFEITGASFDWFWAYFTLGLPINPLNLRDPDERVNKNFCRFNFPNSNDPRCPYTAGVFQSCARTLADCIERNGDLARRYGGYPAIGTNKIYVQS